MVSDPDKRGHKAKAQQHLQEAIELDKECKDPNRHYWRLFWARLIDAQGDASQEAQAVQWLREVEDDPEVNLSAAELLDIGRLRDQLEERMKG